MTLSSRLNDIERRSNDSTAGPWWGSMISGAVEVYAGTGSGSDPMIAVSLRPGDAEFVVGARTDVPQMHAALRAVLTEHPRKWAYDGNLDYCPVCIDHYGADYPCPTVRGVMRALGEDLS